MNNVTRNTLLLTAMMSVLTGTAFAAPTQFTATATVQNAVTLSETTPLNFGTVFATTTATGVVAVEDATYSQKLTITSAGVVAAETPAANVGPVLLSLGGTPTAGAYSAPGLPSNASVAVSLYTAADTAFTNAATAVAAECAYDTPALATAASKIVLTNGADPTTGFFCMDVFTSNRANLFTTGYALGFGVTTLTYNLGATLIAQAPTGTGTTRQYQAGAYTGSFGMEVTFP